ncbi:MAG: hypothetical protein OXC13_15820 [Caldilineaceae bacterium]|nr:hypothetical protein [Caldilineaceae bacterium]
MNRKLEAFILAGIVLVPPPVVASITVRNFLGSAWPVDLIGGFLVAGLWPWGLWALAR